MAALENRLVSRFVSKVAQTLDEVSGAIFLCILKLGIGARKVSAGVSLKLLRQPAIDYPNGDTEKQHHARDHRQEDFCAETEFQSSPEYFHIQDLGRLKIPRVVMI